MLYSNPMTTESSWKIHRFIFRLDFEPDFRLVSQFGHIANAMWSELKDLKDEKWKIKVGHDIIIAGTDKEQKSFVTMNFSFNTAWVDIEHTEGLTVKELGKQRFLSIFSDFWEQLDKKFDIRVNKFLNIGYRVWAIKSTSDGFDKAKEEFNAVMPVFKPLSEKLNLELEDLGYIFEGKDPAGTKVRLLSGPYKEDEIGKYFKHVDPKKEAGQIVDLDLRDNNQRIHGLKVFKIVNSKSLRAGEILCSMWQI